MLCRYDAACSKCVNKQQLIVDFTDKSASYVGRRAATVPHMRTCKQNAWPFAFVARITTSDRIKAKSAR